MKDRCDLCRNECDTAALKRHNSAQYGLLWLCGHCYWPIQHVNAIHEPEDA